MWLYLDTKDEAQVAIYQWIIFWLVIPSLLFFPVFSYLLRHQVAFCGFNARRRRTNHRLLFFCFSFCSKKGI